MSAEAGLERARQGMQFLAIGSDLRMMTLEAQRVLAQLFPERAGTDVARY
jgi:4-hydroxy-2-oxoheptanedioate aldolase